ncbi:MAG TPA: type II secretion system F family protein [Bryobacteraceae bacterium]|nr:type II secretion system F family protein [Bryobacteraceae bacterium]
MAALISLGLFVALMIAITVFGYRRYAKPGRVYEQLGGPVAGDPLLGEAVEDAPGLVVSLIRQIGDKIPISPQDAGDAKHELVAAGFRGDRAVSTLYGIRILLFVALVVLAFLLRTELTSNPVLRVVIVIAAGLAGFFGPFLYLERMVDKRREELRYSLPDALDLMVVSVEAGLGLDQAIQYVARELAVTHKDLSEEFGLLHLEMRAGKRRSDALRNLADRTGEPELRKLIAILIQTDKFGTSMAESLRVHSDFLRVRRRQQAEERAGKVGVKLVFPIFFFIMPAMLLVAAGPGLLQVFKYLFPMMRQFRG